MIAMLRGQVVERTGNYVIVDVNGVGYLVQATTKNLDAWSAAGAITVHVSTQVREDDIALYGFATPTERTAFQVLMGVSGVGPKVALSCLDGMPVGELRRAIEQDDLHALGRISGVGKKIGQRLALELKGKLPVGDFEVQAPSAAPVVDTDDQLFQALSRLGYSRAEIEATRRRLAEQGVPPEAPVAERLRQSLRLLYKPG